MKQYTYSQARQRLSEVLDAARNEEVLITRRGGDSFSIVHKARTPSPFDVPGIATKATTRDILDAVRASRRRGG
jgi:prevent-host-death family protein